jgi:hypothetical protein
MEMDTVENTTQHGRYDNVYSYIRIQVIFINSGDSNLFTPIKGVSVSKEFWNLCSSSYTDIYVI